MLAPHVTTALVYPLSDESIRDAYFFGCSTDRVKVAEFLGQYSRRFEPRDRGPGVWEIELRTPYEQVVLLSQDRQTTGYSAQQAQIEYHAGPGLVKVRVLLFLGVGRPGPAELHSDSSGRVLDRRERFWQAFRFRVSQEHVIEPEKVEGVPVYDRRGKGLSGAEVWMEFDGSKLSPGATRVEVTAPDGRTTVADFALDQLK